MPYRVLCQEFVKEVKRFQNIKYENVHWLRGVYESFGTFCHGSG